MEYPKDGEIYTLQWLTQHQGKDVQSGLRSAIHAANQDDSIASGAESLGKRETNACGTAADENRMANVIHDQDAQRSRSEESEKLGIGAISCSHLQYLDISQAVTQQTSPVTPPKFQTGWPEAECPTASPIALDQPCGADLGQQNHPFLETCN